MRDLPVAVNDLVQVRILDEEPTSTYSSRVDDIVGGELVLAWPTSSGVIVPLRLEQPLTLYFSRDDAVYGLDALVKKTLREPFPRIYVAASGAMHRIQRRNYFRVRAMLPVQLTGIVKSGDSGKDGKEKTVHIVTHTVNISGAGMAIHHGSSIPTDAMFEARLTIDKDDPPLKLLARVVHAEPVLGATERRMYHVALFFVSIRESQRRLIVRRLFRIQQENAATCPPQGNLTRPDSAA